MLLIQSLFDGPDDVVIEITFLGWLKTSNHDGALSDTTRGREPVKAKVR